MGIRIRVLPGCNGLGTCVRKAPELFRIDQKTGKAVAIREEADGCLPQLQEIRQECPFIAVEVDGVPLEEPFDQAPVVAVNRLTADVVELRLTRPGYSFKPGQYAFLRLRDADGEFYRAYSIVGAAAGQVTFCIKLLPDGRAGRALGAVKPGDTLGLGRPLGVFGLTTPDRSKLFIAGGTGLAPVVPMCEATPQADKTVILGVRSAGDLFWVDRLAALPRTKVVPVLENPAPDWAGQRGLVTDALARLDPLAFDEIYTCGGPRMVEAVRAQLAARGVPESRIRADSFELASTPAAAAAGFDWQTLYRRVHFYASLSLAALILFYAITGFIANRMNLFTAEEGRLTEASARTVPDSVALAEEPLRAFLASLVPPAARPAGFTQTDREIVAPYIIPADGAEPQHDLVVTVDRETRAVAIDEWRRLPDDLATDATALVAYLRGRLTGKPDLANADENDTHLALDFGSVWGIHAVRVDKEKRRWQMTTSRPQLADVLIALHRGKYTGWLQKLLVDATAVLLSFVTLSGVAMGLTTPARRRRWMTAALVVGSLVLLAVLVWGR
jgi:ferredoxin-NADP reductase/ferredoxin